MKTWRHALRAAALVLALLALALLEAHAIGWADAKPALAAPPVLELPGPHVGDRGVYRIERSSGDTWLERFEVLPAARLHDAAGQERSTWPVRIERTPDAAPDSRERVPNTPAYVRYYDAATHELVAVEEQRGAASDSAVTGHSETTASILRLIGPRSAEPSNPSRIAEPALCGFFQAPSALGLNSTVPWHESCLIRDGEEPWLVEGETRVDAHGVYTQRDAMRLDALAVGRGADAWNLSVWYAQGAPVPALIRLDQADKVYRMQLVTFAPGSDPLAALAADASTPEAPLLEPMQPWGPADAGVNHPYPLSRAWTEAWNDVPKSGLRDFVLAHPAARVMSAEYQGRIWHIQLSDGHESFAMCRAPEASLTCAENPAPRDVSCAPAMLPSVRSMEGLWRLHARPSEANLPLKAWAFRLDCGRSRMEATVRLEHFERENLFTSPPSQGPASDAYRWMDVTYDETGALRLVERGASAADVLLPQVRSSRTGTPTLNRGVPPPEEPRILTAGFVTSSPPALLQRAGWIALALALGLGVASFAKAGVAGYSRLDPRRLLEQRTRARISSIVAAAPGIHAREIARRAGRPRGTVDHHLQVLVQHGVLVQHSGAGFECYFPVGRVDRRLHAAASVLKAPAARLLLGLAASRPGLYLSEAARAAALTRQGAARQARRLQAAGLVEVDAAGRHRRLRATAAGHEALKSLVYGPETPSATLISATPAGVAVDGHS